MDEHITTTSQPVSTSSGNRSDSPKGDCCTGFVVILLFWWIVQVINSFKLKKKYKGR